MKNIIVLLFTMLFLAAGTVFGQQVQYAEYFWDTDNGVGTGTPLTITPGDEIIETGVAISLSGLSAGYHILNIRVRDANGTWSIAHTQRIFIYDNTPLDLTYDNPEIVYAEYVLDNMYEPGSGTPISITQGDNLDESFTVPATDLAPGYHWLNVRVKDADGKWSQLFSKRFFVIDTTTVDLRTKSSSIVAAEYFFDKDSVSQGKGIPLPVISGDEVSWVGNISVEGLGQGNHFLFVRVKDSRGKWSIAVAEPFNVVNLKTETNSPICPGTSEGKAKVTLEGGVPPFTYLWDDPFQQKADSATGLAPGTYTVTVTDAEGAIVKETIEITEYDLISISITTDDTDCNEAEGSATAQVDSGGIAPFKYSWTTGSEEKSTTNLRSGIYYVTVTDLLGCSNTAVATINDVNGPQISVNGIQHLDCAGDADGYIDVGITGGSGGYAIEWSNGETTEDIINLTAGPYEITVFDDQLCRSSKSIVVKQPDPLTFKLSVNPSDCNQATGSATVSVFGGTAPYGYLWQGGGFLPTRENLAAGVYTVNVIDDNGCTADVRVAVSDKNAPVVNVTEIVESTCGLTDGEILISVAGGATGIYTYSWKKDGLEVGTSRNLTGVGPGDYDVAVKDGTCKTLATATIPAELPPTDPICLVTVDTASGKNLVVWQKTAGEGIISYNIYRETSQAGVFNLISNQPYDSLSQYMDVFADPVVRSWRYKISAVDNCGNESRLSAYHKTMHLTLNLGLLGGVNLIWNHYEGFSPFEKSYNIWRFSGGNWEMLTSIPSNLDSYTDQSPPAGLIWYYVEAIHPTGCTPTEFKAGTLNSSRSNRQSRLKTGIQEEINEQYNLRIYPNPSSGKFTLSMDLVESENVDIRVYDISGKLVYISSFDNYIDKLETEIDMTGYAKGIYYLTVKTDKGIFNNALIIE